MVAQAVQWSSPDKWCCLIDLVTGDTLKWQDMPMGVGYGKTANYDQVPILGRSLPIYSYGSSTSVYLNITLTFIATGEGGKTPNWVRQQVDWLESLTYPDYKGGITFPPHPVAVIVGEAFEITGVVNQFGVNYTPPWDINSGKSFKAEVSIGIAETQPNAGNKPYGWADIKGGVR